MLIVKTHPSNKGKIGDIARKDLHVINLDKVKTIYDADMEINSIIGHTGTSERFCEWGISDWEIYFGFATPLYKPLFLLVENGRGDNMSKVRQRI